MDSPRLDPPPGMTIETVALVHTLLSTTDSGNDETLAAARLLRYAFLDGTPSGDLIAAYEQEHR